MFCDELKLTMIAGQGGDGCVSFRREKFVPRGGPDGGDGGNGGNIFIRADANINTLGHLANKKVYRANKGGHGLGKKMAGKTGDDLTLIVPKGTIIFNSDKSTMLADLNNEGDSYIVAKGGKGGLGNTRFTSSTHQAPRFAEKGEPGESNEILMELKLVADVGFIGLPSAGKSTLISVISNARPKIAAYHFTTLIPNLGVVNMGQFGGSKNDSFVAADIPGLIKGASKGKGLGHQFLKHISRTKLLVHIIDGYSESPVKNYRTINKELKEFDPNLAKLEQIIVINKIDLLDGKTLKKRVASMKKIAKKAKIFSISGITREGLKPLLFEISKQLIKLKKAKPKAKKEKKEIPILKPHLDQVKFEIDKIINKKDHKIFRISGKRIEQLLIMTDTSNLEGLERIYHFMEKMGIKKAIEQKGAKFGDIIKIGEKHVAYRK
ncbi:MAG: GTPase ObgE [bacterium]|nr:GTPase ObgE [bacterium]